MNKKTNMISELKNFYKVIIAKLACESGKNISKNHFVDINKMVNISTTSKFNLQLFIYVLVI